MFFKFTTSGESHGKALVSIVEGLPAGLPIDIEAINHELWRRQQGYGRGGRMKIETDTIEFLSGVRHGKTLGSPIALKIENRDFVHWQEVMSDTELVTQPKKSEAGQTSASRTRRSCRRPEISGPRSSGHFRARFRPRDGIQSRMRSVGKTAS